MEAEENVDVQLLLRQDEQAQDITPLLNLIKGRCTFADHFIPKPVSIPEDVYQLASVFVFESKSWKVTHRGKNMETLQGSQKIDPDKDYSAAYCEDSNELDVFLLQDKQPPLRVNALKAATYEEQLHPIMKEARIKKALAYNNRDPANSFRCIMPEAYFQANKEGWKAERPTNERKE